MSLWAYYFTTWHEGKAQDILAFRLKYVSDEIKCRDWIISMALQQLNEWWVSAGCGWWWCITMVLMFTEYFSKVFVRFYFIRPCKLSSDSDSSKAIICAFGGTIILGLCCLYLQVNHNENLLIFFCYYSFFVSCYSGKVSETPLWLTII